jgi:hypothetical protein
MPRGPPAGPVRNLPRSHSEHIQADEHSCPRHRRQQQGKRLARPVVAHDTAAGPEQRLSLSLVGRTLLLGRVRSFERDRAHCWAVAGLASALVACMSRLPLGAAVELSASLGLEVPRLVAVLAVQSPLAVSSALAVLVRSVDCLLFLLVVAVMELRLAALEDKNVGRLRQLSWVLVLQLVLAPSLSAA